MKLYEIANQSASNLFAVHVPANVNTGRYYDHRTIRILVVAQSEQDAIQIVNKYKSEVLLLADQMKYNRAKRMVASPVEKNVFFKDRYYVQQKAPNIVSNGHTILSANGLDVYKGNENE